MDDALRILRPYLRGLPLIVLAMAAAALFAKKYLSYVTPKYESTAKIKIADVNEGVPGSNLFKDFDVFATTHKITGEIELIRSSSMITRVLDGVDFDLELYRVGKVRKVELYHDSPFRVRFTTSDARARDIRYSLHVFDRTRFDVSMPDRSGTEHGEFGKPMAFRGGTLLLTLDTAFLQSKPDSKLADDYEFELISRERLIARIASDLDVIAVDKDVPVIRVSYKSPVALKASVFVNAMAEAYINDYIETKYRAAGVTVRFLDDRISDIASKLTTSEQSIQQYRDDRSIVNLRQETETDLRQISQLKIQQANLRMNLDAINTLDQYIREGKNNFLELAPNFEAFTDLLSTEIVKKIKQLQSDKKDLLLTYTPEDERVKVVDLKISDLTSYLAESIKNTRENLQVKYNRLGEEISEAEKVFIGVPEKERMLTILNREFEIYQRSYNFLNEKKIEAEIAQAARIAFHRVISPGMQASQPVSPNTKIIIIVATLLGMFGAIAGIFLVHAWKAKVNDVYTIERNSAVPIVLQTPYLDNETKTGACFQKHAIQLELKNLLAQRSIVVISSAGDREGKSLHAHHLADALSRQGRKVMLVRVQPQRTFHSNGGFDETLLPAEARLFTRESMQDYFNLFTGYDVVVVDNEPTADESVGVLIMSVATANLFVLDSRRTAEKEIVKAELLQQKFSLPSFSFILNRAGYSPSLVGEAISLVRLVPTIFRRAHA